MRALKIAGVVVPGLWLLWATIMLLKIYNLAFAACDYGYKGLDASKFSARDLTSACAVVLAHAGIPN
jgi:hypothetical protein